MKNIKFFFYLKVSFFGCKSFNIFESACFRNVLGIVHTAFTLYFRASFLTIIVLKLEQIHFTTCWCLEKTTLIDERQTVKLKTPTLNYSPVSILYKSIAGRYRPVRVDDRPITARCRFIKNASWEKTKQGHSIQIRQFYYIIVWMWCVSSLF